MIISTQMCYGYFECKSDWQEFIVIKYLISFWPYMHCAYMYAHSSSYAMLTTFQECDMGNLIDLRKQHKDEFEKKHGVKLGFMSAFVLAATAALKEVHMRGSCSSPHAHTHRRWPLFLCMCVCMLYEATPLSSL